MTSSHATAKCAVFVAHPGHELRIHRWIELNAPTVLILTDGSGRTHQSRLPSTERILAATGAKPGPIFGRFPDQHVYEKVLAGDSGFFLGLARETAEFLEQAKIELLAGDAAEGYNTSHDLCRYLIDMAVERVRQRTGRKIAMYRFLLAGRPEECPAELRAAAIWVHLDEAALQRKLAAAQGYPELAAEVEHVRQKFGFAPFMVECLQPVDPAVPDETGEHEKPYYETYGEKQKAAGFYRDVIRYAEHVAPIRAALAAWARSDVP
jgi:hypothetical protein